jgi:hypothetical protein
MMRWLEEFELKHAEFTRCIKSFKHMQGVWESLASEASKPGYTPFALRQADMYHGLYQDAQQLFDKHGEANLVKGSPTFMSAACMFQEKELAWLEYLMNSKGSSTAV